MSLATDLAGIGLAPEQALRLGYTKTTKAGVGTAQSGAAAISTNLIVATTASGQTAFVLPSTAELMVPYIVVNTSATAALVFPPSGGAINAAGANASVSIAQNVSRVFYRVDTTRWISFLAA
ncbi:hypothetical protein D3C80_253860 [compost metagenome]